jgi:predicted secreted acid phosphatase
MYRKLLSVAALIIICLATAAAFAQSAADAQRSLLENLGLAKMELIKYADTGGYERDLAAAAARASAWLAGQAGRTGKLAMVLDIDETALSNWPLIKRNNFGVIIHGPIPPCGWNSWVHMARDKAIMPTLKVYRQARRQNVAVFFITGRDESLRGVTESNLRAAGYQDWTALVMEPDGPNLKSAADFKAPARKKIVGRGYTIVVNMGDQDSDLEGGYAERTFKLPDPFYYIP